MGTGCVIQGSLGDGGYGGNFRPTSNGLTMKISVKENAAISGVLWVIFGL